MSVEAHRGLRGSSFKLRSEAERAEAFAHAGRHSRIVRTLRRVLPIVAIVVVAAYFISSSMSVEVGGVTASISGVHVRNGILRMTNPKLRGVDKKNGAYVISAAYADQDVKTPKIIQLHTIKAILNSASGGWSKVDAVRGTYNAETQELVLRDSIKLATSSGVTGTLTYATVDMKNQLLHSPVPVFFRMQNGTVRSDELTMRAALHELEFKGHVKVHLEHLKKLGTGQHEGEKKRRDVEANAGQNPAPATMVRENRHPLADVPTVKAPEGAVR